MAGRKAKLMAVKRLSCDNHTDLREPKGAVSECSLGASFSKEIIKTSLGCSINHFVWDLAYSRCSISGTLHRCLFINFIQVYYF